MLGYLILTITIKRWLFNKIIELLLCLPTQPYEYDSTDSNPEANCLW